MSEDFARARRRMVDLIRRRGVTDVGVLNAIERLPRERFVPEDMAGAAHDDAPLPIGEGQTISQPFVVALMIEAAGVAAGSRVLEIGAGSGYSAAVMAAMGAHVFAIERNEALATAAAARLAALEYDDVQLRTGDGTAGWPEFAPFDAIVVTAGGPSVPETLRLQLAHGGRLVMPVGSRRDRQTLVRVTRTGEEEFAEEALGSVAFVPLIGAHGWRD